MRPSPRRLGAALALALVAIVSLGAAAPLAEAALETGGAVGNTNTGADTSLSSPVDSTTGTLGTGDSSSFASFTTADTGTTGGTPSTGGTSSTGGTGTTGNTTSSAAAPSNGAATTKSTTNSKTAQQLTTPPKGGVIDDSTYGWLMTRIMGLFAWLLGVATLMLDAAVYYGVVVMGAFINNLHAIGVAWHALRDIGNILLIFGFLLAGIATIIDLEIYGFGSKMLPMLLVAAVFINFSLFISEAVVDVGNLFATEFYQQINNGQIVGPSQFASGTDAIHNEGISNRIMSVLGLPSIYNLGLSNAGVANGSTLQGAAKQVSGNYWYIGFMAIILFAVAAFVMLSLAFVIIARFVALVFLLVIAPVGFAGLAIPKLSGAANLWWRTLFEQTLTAPVLLLLLYVALAVITDANFLTGFDVKGGAQGANTYWNGFVDGKGLTGFVGIFFSFLVAMGLLMAVVVVSKRMSAFGASWASRMSGRIIGGAIGVGVGRVGLGGASLAGRVGIGLPARLANSRYVRAKAAQGGVRSLGWRALAFTGRNLENRTFDLRNVKVAQKAGRAVTGAIRNAGAGLEHVGAGLAAGAGTGATLTAKGAVEKVQQAWKKISPLHGWEGSWWRDQQKEYEKAEAEVERKKKLATPGSPDFITEMKRMSDDELAELRGIRQGLAAFVAVLSPEKYRKLQQNTKLLAAEKANLRRGWEAQFTPAAAAVTLGRMNTEEIAGLEGNILTRNAVVEALGQNELEAIRRKGLLKADERRTMYAIMHGAAVAGTPFGLEVRDYFDPANDVGGNRQRYWNV